MLLEPQEVEHYFNLRKALDFFVNTRAEVTTQKPGATSRFPELSLDERLKIRDEILSHPQLIDEFTKQNPDNLTDDDLEIVRSWQHQIFGKFYIFRQLTKYAIVLSMTDPVIAYGVVALSDPFEDVIGRTLPVLVEIALLPYKGRIIYDGLIASYPIVFGGGFRRSMNESFKEAKARQGIVTLLPMSVATLPRSASQPRPAPKAPIRAEGGEVDQIIIRLTDQFCEAHLNEEYAVLCRKMAEKLARKRPSPLLHGKPNVWACGIVRVVGGVNFLHDKSQAITMRTADIDHYFGISASTAGAKAAAIRQLLKIKMFDHTWTLPSRMEDSPMMWMVSVNGLFMDIRHAPRELQEAAFKKGLIPYIPADRQ